MSASSNSRGKTLQDLFIDWQSLIRKRAGARQGTSLRSQLDAIYFKTLPVIVQITESVDDQEVSELVQLAMTRLKPIISNQGETACLVTQD